MSAFLSSEKKEHAKRLPGSFLHAV